MVEHTKECKYRVDNDLPHTNCYCKCHKIIMMESTKNGNQELSDSFLGSKLSTISVIVLMIASLICSCFIPDLLISFI